MEDLDRRVRLHLVLTAGFSQVNAVKALEMYHRDELQKTEKEVISNIMLDPEDNRRKTFPGSLEEFAQILTRLNYRITQNGGEPITKASRHGRKI